MRTCRHLPVLFNLYSTLGREAPAEITVAPKTVAPHPEKRATPQAQCSGTWSLSDGAPGEAVQVLLDLKQVGVSILALNNLGSFWRLHLENVPRYHRILLYL